MPDRMAVSRVSSVKYLLNVKTTVRFFSEPHAAQKARGAESWSPAQFDIVVNLHIVCQRLWRTAGDQRRYENRIRREATWFATDCFRRAAVSGCSGRLAPGR